MITYDERERAMIQLVIRQAVITAELGAIRFVQDAIQKEAEQTGDSKVSRALLGVVVRMGATVQSFVDDMNKIDREVKLLDLAGMVSGQIKGT